MWCRMLYSTLGQETRCGTILYLGNRHITFCHECELKLIEQILCSVCVIWYSRINPHYPSPASKTATVLFHCKLLKILAQFPLSLPCFVPISQCAFYICSQHPYTLGKESCPCLPMSLFILSVSERNTYLCLWAEQIYLSTTTHTTGLQHNFLSDPYFSY